MHHGLLGIQKRFPLPKEGHTIEFRGEFYDLLNRPNFGNPVANLGSPAFLITEDSQAHLGAGNVLDSGFDPVDLNRCGMYNKYLITKEVYMPKNHVQFQKGQSLRDFLKLYGTELQCAQAVFQARWPQGFRCPACG